MKKQIFKTIRIAFGAMAILSLICLIFWPHLLGAAGIIYGTIGAVVTDAALTTESIDANASDLLLDDIDKEVTKMWPSYAPLDQLFRTGMKGSRRGTNSIKARHYSVEVKPFTDVVTADITASNQQSFNLPVGNIDLYGLNDTIFIPSVGGYAEGKGTDKLANAPLQLFVYEIDKSSNILKVIPVNGDNATVANKSILKTGQQDIAQNAQIVIGPKALNELDIQTAPSSYVPEDDYNYCQYFGSQIEISKWANKHSKEVNFSEADQMELLMYEYRVKREIAYWFGTRNIINPNGKKIYTCGGITNFVSEEVDWTSLLANGKPTIKSGHIDDMVRAAFSGNAGSGQRWMFVGEHLFNALKRTEDIQKTLSAKDTQYEFGLYFNKINTGDGELILIKHPLFKQMGWSYNAVIIDANNIGERHFKAQNVENFDKAKMGQSNSDAKFISEVSCPVIKYGKTHTVIKGPVYTSLV